MYRAISGVALLVLAGIQLANAQSGIERNVIYGMHSGLALLLDVHRPEKPNGLGVIFVSGSGWQAPMGYGATGLKEQQIGLWGPPLQRAGYTVFAINHRAAPRFHYPTALEDVQRAVRFVRHHARDYGIDPTRLAGVGGSSGGHLLSLTGMLAAPGSAGDADPVQREPATLQTLVLRAAPTDLRVLSGPALVSFMERMPDRTSEDRLVFAAASPVTHVSKSSPSALLLHGDSDDSVPLQQSIGMEAAMRAAGVPVKLVIVPDGEHGPDFGTPGKPHPQLAKLFAETVSWLDTHLRSAQEFSRGAQ